MPENTPWKEGNFVQLDMFLLSNYDDWKAEKPADLKKFFFDGVRFWYRGNDGTWLGIEGKNIPSNEPFAGIAPKTIQG